MKMIKKKYWKPNKENKDKKYYFDVEKLKMISEDYDYVRKLLLRKQQVEKENKNGK